MNKQRIFKKIIFYGAFLSLFILLPKNALADSSSCQAIYGGGQTCPPQVAFFLKKQVLKPGTSNDFVENLSVNDPKYKPGEQVIFKITVKNTGSQKISRLEVTDTLPDFLNFVTATAGNFDQSKKTLTATFNDIDPDKSADFSIVGRIVEANSLPSDQGIFCLINQARAFEEHGLTANDTAQFCIERQTLGAISTPEVFKPQKVNLVPKTGAKTLPILGFLLLFITGLVLTKRSRNLKKLFK